MRKLGVWLAGLGVLLALGAVLAFVVLFDTGAGDVEAIESSLVPAATLPVPAAIAQPVEVAPTVPGNDTPLVEANQVSRLDQLAQVTTRTPIGLEIESLGVNAQIGAYGIDQRTGQMDVPNNVREVGWYQHGPAPGEPGSSVLAAHVDLKSQGPGVFFDLKTLDPGELLTVTFDDGSIQRFQVKARNTYLKDELPLEVIFSKGGAPVLTLITCGGGFSPSVESYDSNVVVYAVPLDSAGEALPLS